MRGIPLIRSDRAKSLFFQLMQNDMETWQHSLRVNHYCRILGRSLGLTEDQMNRLSLLAVFHDIGKLGISQNILKKRGDLTAKEWNTIKLHPQFGCRMALKTPEVSEVANCILCHHEHWNGSGYPHGLQGTEIPYLCRILAVSDPFDAMTTNRSYRRALKSDNVIAEFAYNSGKQFDPAVVRILMNSVLQEWMRDRDKFHYKTQITNKTSKKRLYLSKYH